MTPKEKAADLIVSHQVNCKSLSYEDAKECAIMLVDAVIAETYKYAERYEQYVMTNVSYWKEVEEEINKM
jgi:hypothetical protein